MTNLSRWETQVSHFFIWGYTFIWGDFLKQNSHKPLLYLCNRYKMACDRQGGCGLGLKKDPIKKRRKYFLTIPYFEAMTATYYINSN